MSPKQSLRPDQFELYKPLSAAAAEAFGGQYLVRGGDSTCVEGQGRLRNVIVEFPSYQAALDAYHSPEYTKARGTRKGAADFNLTVVEGT